MVDETGANSFSRSPEAPKELQEKFAEWIGGSRSDCKIFDVHPEFLLVVSGHVEHISREYYLSTQEGFSYRARAGFDNKNGKWNVSHIQVYGESQAFITVVAKTESVDLDFEYLFAWRINLNKGYLTPSYDNQGKLRYLDLTRVKRQGRDPEGLMNDRNHNSLKIEHGEVVTVDRGCERYNMMLEDGRVLLKRFEGDILTDKISLPFVVDREKIIEDLVRPGTLQDPRNADPELDRSWRLADLLETVGISWMTYRPARSNNP